jgi:hypothetical protein
LIRHPKRETTEQRNIRKKEEEGRNKENEAERHLEGNGPTDQWFLCCPPLFFLLALLHVFRGLLVEALGLEWKVNNHSLSVVMVGMVLTLGPPLAGADDSAVASDRALLEVEAPAGAEVTIDGEHKGQRRHFPFQPFRPGQQVSHDVRVKFRDGSVTERTVLLRGGWRVRLPVGEPGAGARPELVPQTGHTGRINAVAFSPDGRYVITGADDSTAQLWEAHTGRKVRDLKGHTGYVTAGAFSPDGKNVLTGSWNRTAILWEAATGRVVQSFPGHRKDVTSVAFTRDGKHILIGEWGQPSGLWEVATGNEVQAFKGTSDGVAAVALSSDGKFLLTGHPERKAVLWEVATGRELRAFEGHTGKVFAVAFSPDGKLALTGSEDNAAALWEADTGRQVRVFKGHSNIAGRVGSSLWHSAPMASMPSPAPGTGQRYCGRPTWDAKFRSSRDTRPR